MPRQTIMTIALSVALSITFGVPAFAGDIDERLQALEQEVQRLRLEREADQDTIHDLQDQLDTAEEGWSEVYREVEEIGRSEEDLADSNFMLTGYGEFRFFDRDGDGGSIGGDNGSFQLHHFNPIFHYRMGDRLTWVSELELELESEFETDDEFENEDLEISLEYSYLDYEVADYLTFRAGKFFTPLGIFNERLHPAWINKLPTRPVPYVRPTMLLPMTDVGIMARGGTYVSDEVMVNYALALTNGPFASDVDMLAVAGAFTDNNNNKTWSGRLGVVPYPGFEFGVSGMTGAYSHDGRDDYQAIVLDASVQLFANLLDIRAEYVTTEQERSLSPDVDRDGWWLQAAHRLAWLENEYLQNTEMVIRYGEVESDIFAEDDRENLTLGLNYYILNNFTARVSYDWYDGNADNTRNDQFTAQLTYGF